MEMEQVSSLELLINYVLLLSSFIAKAYSLFLDMTYTIFKSRFRNFSIKFKAKLRIKTEKQNPLEKRNIIKNIKRRIFKIVISIHFLYDIH